MAGHAKDDLNLFRHPKSERQWANFIKSLIQYLAPPNSMYYGTGTPESNVTADVGSLYLRTDGGTNTTLYVKESGTGNTGWAAI